MIDIESLAKAAAAKICTRRCTASYTTCERAASQKPFVVGRLPLIGKGTVCPLAKYNVPDTPLKPFYMVRRNELPTVYDCLYLCANCKHATATVTANGDLRVRKDGFHEYCIDCPSQHIYDAIKESQAEGMMS
jgi:hypothetical protein